MEQTEDLIQLSDPGERGREQHNRGDRFTVQVANIAAWTFPILMIAIVAQVILRASGYNQAWLDDLQWWLYGGSALVAIAYAVTTDSHVRVDIFHENFADKKRVRIEIFALAWLFLPFVILAWDITIPYALQAFQIDEGSSSPNGLHNLWILKIFMNVAFILVAIATWAAYVRQVARVARPVLWRQMLWALPSTIYLVNLVVYYTIWWILRLTTPAEIDDRELGRHAIFGEFELGAEEIKYTILITVVVTIIVLAVARAMDRGDDAEA